jgi:hypothetical protein
MREQIFLGGCPVIRPEGIYINGQRVIRLGLQGVGLGDVGDLLSYRQMWEPFIAAHLTLWRNMNEILENSAVAKECPSGASNPSLQSFCAALALTRIYTSDTHPLGILPQWNAWKDKSSADITAGASSMLESQQNVVLRVGNTYKNELVKIAKNWNVDLKLPPVPSFDLQQEIRARIAGAYVTAKGIIQIVGYGYGEALMMATDTAQATAQGLKETAQDIPRTTRWVAVAATVAAVVVGGGLIIYYLPRQSTPKTETAYP